MTEDNDKDNGTVDVEIELDESAGDNGNEDLSEEGKVWSLDEADDSLEQQVAELGGDMEFDLEEESPSVDWEVLYRKKKSDLKQLRDRLLRLTADFENYRKRIAKERADLIKYCNENLLVEILPVKDDLERALDAGKETHDIEKLIEGLDLILNKFSQTLEKFGVAGIDAIGKKFDPNFHEALSRIETSDMEENTVVQEYKRGYTVHEKLLRPAQVVVSTLPGTKRDD